MSTPTYVDASTPNYTESAELSLGLILFGSFPHSQALPPTKHS